jgi:ABC-2 type transport system ATP-binding protein
LSDSPPEFTLTARNLQRRFGARVVVDNVSLALRRGEVLGLLGHNGAGKSTTLQMLSGCLLPDGGEIEICGNDLLRQPLQAKRQLGYLPEIPPLYREMRVDDYLRFAARLHRLSAEKTAAAIAGSLHRCGLENVRQKRIGTLSKGYQQRVGIAQAIVHQPDVIILDEPTVGLDPAQIRDIRTLVRELANHHSVLLSTHLLSEVEAICDRVNILHQGRMVFDGTTAALAAHDGAPNELEANFLRITGAAS